MRYPWYTWTLLLMPGRVQRNLDAVRAAELVPRVPNLWQICLGVLRMWHRILFRSSTIGLCTDHRRRPGWRARLFEPRVLRGPFLFWEGSVIPWDLTGLLSSPDRLIRHLLGTHHENQQFVYDLELLAVHPGQLEKLLQGCRVVIQNDTRRTRWLRDLCVYEHYHEDLLRAAELALAGAATPDELRHDADVSLPGYLDWCAAQPTTPGASWKAWRNGELRFAPEAP